MQASPQQDGLEVDPQEVLQQLFQPQEQQLVMTADDESLRQAQQIQRTQKQQQLLMVDSLGQLHHYVAPENIPGIFIGFFQFKLVPQHIMKEHNIM